MRFTVSLCCGFVFAGALYAAAPDIAQELIAQGVQASAQGHTDQAEQLFKKAIEKNPNAPEGYSNLAQLYLKLGKTELAEQNFAQLSRLYQKEKPRPVAAGRLEPAARVPTRSPSDQTELNLGF